MLTVALPTGRVMEDARRLLRELGLPTEALGQCGRELVVDEGEVRYLLAKPTDVPVYVLWGAADLALAGSDVLRESGAPLVELGDTGYGRCHLVVAGPPALSARFAGAANRRQGLRVATKYPRIADSHFSGRGTQVEIVSLHGSIELAPRLGMADCILDIVQTGSTLRANGLVVLEDVGPVSLRMVASPRSARLRWDLIAPLAQALEQHKKNSRLFGPGRHAKAGSEKTPPSLKEGLHE